MQPVPLRPIRSASVLIPTWQGMEFLERVLDALAAQEADFPWDVHVIDSGSKDGTWETLVERQEGFPVPLCPYSISQVEFDHGDTRNQLAMRSAGDLLVYLSQDAIPARPDWLRLLAKNFEDPLVGGAYCRNVPRPESHLLTKIFSRIDPGYATERVEHRVPDRETYAVMDVDSRRVLYNFNNVASAIPRELWERHPFPRTTMGEDVLMGRAVLEAGYTTVYDVDATVHHSHDYDAQKMHWRGEVDGRFNAEWLDRICIASEEHLETLLERQVKQDKQALKELKVSLFERKGLLQKSRELRGAMLRGLYEGGLATTRYYRTAMRARSDMRLFYAVEGVGAHGALEAQVLELAKEMVRRGHGVTLLTTVAPEEGEPEFSMRREEADGLRVLRWARSQREGSTDAAESDSPTRAALAALIASEAPELVHLHHRGGALLGLVPVAREHDLPVVVTCHEGPESIASSANALENLALADMRITPNRDTRERYLEVGSFDPHLFLFSETAQREAEASEAIRAEARELEFRYRGLSCIVRSRWGTDGVLLRAAGTEATIEGEASQQGPDWQLLRPGAFAEYSLEGSPAGPVKIDLDQYALASESGIIALGGRALIDGVEVGRFEPIERVAEDAKHTQTIECELPKGARRIRLEPVLEGGPPKLHLRLCRLLIQRAGAEDAGADGPPPADLRRLAEELRVVPGAALPPEELPAVSIVIPNLDGRPVLPDCLASLDALEYDRERLEILLVDNGSGDGSVDYVREHFPRVKLVPRSENTGFAAACNEGARQASHAVLAFLNNDMRCEPSFLTELVSPIARGECQATTAKMLGWDGKTIDGAGTGTTFAGIAIQPGYGQPPGPEHDVPRKSLFACGGAMAIDAETFAKAGGFDEEYFAYYEDLDLGWRLWVLGHAIHYVPSAVCYHHHSHTSERFPLETVRLVMVRNSLYTCIKNYDDENLERILPVMLSLAVKRALLKAELQGEPFRIQNVRPRSADQEPPQAEGAASIQRVGAADLIAIDDLLGDWDHWMQRRREVQSRRKRSDAEIQRLFLEPLACVEADPQYAALQDGLVRLFGLDRVFARS